jgi:hypothetical protein
MKSLAQVEPRIPISTAGIVISQPGNYYLTNDLEATVSPGWVITIRAEDVTLDLNGFALTAAPGVGVVADSAPAGIIIDVVGKGTTIIKNGHIRGNRHPPITGGISAGEGLHYGIIAINETSADSSTTMIEGIVFSGLVGAVSTTNSTIRNCHVTGAYGSLRGSLIQNCLMRCDEAAITGTRVEHCIVRNRSLTRGGIFATEVLGCTVLSNAPETYESITAERATDCSINFGNSSIRATLATNCKAYRIDATTAVGCIRTTGTITNRYNMP